MADNQEHLLDLRSKLDRVCTGIDVMSDKQEQMSEDIAKIKVKAAMFKNSAKASLVRQGTMRRKQLFSGAA